MKIWQIWSVFGFIIMSLITVTVITLDSLKKDEKIDKLVKEIQATKVIQEKNANINKFASVIQLLNPKVDKNVAFTIAKETLENCKKYELSPLFVICLINRESSFRQLVVSKADCIGLMQINPKAHPEKVEPFEYYELFHINNNIDIGCQILKEYSEGVSIKETLKRYLGANNRDYINDILESYMEISMKHKEFI